MLKSKLSNISNPPVSLADFKAYIGGINHTQKDADIQRWINAAIVVVSKMSNIPAADFDVELTQDKPTLKQDLLFDNITITTAKDLITGDDLTYTTNAKNSVINTESEHQYLINYSCVRVDNDVLSSSILDYSVMKYTGSTDMDARKAITVHLRTIQSEIY